MKVFKKGKIIRNRVQCNICDDIIESKYCNDFVTCSCGNISVTGGCDYIKRIGCVKNYTELSKLSKFE